MLRNLKFSIYKIEDNILTPNLFFSYIPYPGDWNHYLHLSHVVQKSGNFLRLPPLSPPHLLVLCGFYLLDIS